MHEVGDGRFAETFDSQYLVGALSPVGHSMSKLSHSLGAWFLSASRRESRLAREPRRSATASHLAFRSARGWNATRAWADEEQDPQGLPAARLVNDAAASAVFPVRSTFWERLAFLLPARPSPRSERRPRVDEVACHELVAQPFRDGARQPASITTGAPRLPAAGRRSISLERDLPLLLKHDVLGNRAPRRLTLP